MKFTGERLIPKINKNTAFYHEHLNRYLFACQFSKNKTVLDCACGTGYGSFLLSQYGKATNVTGVDISKETIKYANHHYSLPNIKYLIDNVESLNYLKPNSFDQIISFETIEHINNPSIAVENFKKVLAKNGLLIISTPNIDNYSNHNQFHLHELNYQSFQKILKNNFKNVEIINQKYFLSQQIYSQNSEKFLFNKQTFQKFNAINLNLNKYLEKPEYFIALCSDSSLPKYSSQNISTNLIDNLNLSYGIIPLENKIFQLEKQLSEITSSKFFKLWPLYCQLKKIFKI